MLTYHLHLFILFTDDVITYSQFTQISYVVKMNAKRLLASSQPCWTFTHPNRAPIIDNRRACRLTFVAEADGTVWLILVPFLLPDLENNPMAGTRTCRDFPLRTVW